MKEKRSLILFGLLAGLVAVGLAAFGNPGNMAICVACFIRDSAGALYMHSAAKLQYIRPEIVGIVLGAMAMALMKKEFRPTSGSSPALRFLLGIVTMIGALQFLGCPLRMVLRMAAGDLNAWVALLGFAGGIATGVFFLKKGYNPGRAYEGARTDSFVVPVILVVVFLLSVTTTLFARSSEGPGSIHAAVLISLAGGLIFGAVAQRSRMCFAGGIRDTFLMGDMSGILVIGLLFAVMLVYNLINGSFHLSFTGQPVAHAEALWNIVGMFIVGMAATFAGGCPLRQLILAGSGSSDAAMNVLGMFVGAGVVHNFGLAASGDGTTAAGRIAAIACVAILFTVGFANTKKTGA